MIFAPLLFAEKLPSGFIEEWDQGRTASEGGPYKDKKNQRRA
jgi:hypothetical protein